MKRFTLFMFSLLTPLLLLAQEAEKSLDEKINEWMEPATAAISSVIFYTINFTDEIAIPFVLIWLVVGAVVFTVYMKFINIRGFRLAIDIVRGVYSNPNDKGEVSHFQALTAALSGTVGLGNIAGVAIAISLGGPGATFWMIIAGILGMSSKFVECTLGVKYRVENEDGSVSGGPMYYLSRGFEERGFGKIGKVLAAFFAIMCIGGSIGGGNMFQVNQAFQQFEAVTGGVDSFIYGKGWLFGLVMAGLVGIVIIGGIKRIAAVTSKIVPIMGLLYVIGSLSVIFFNIDNIGESFVSIFRDAFTGSAAAGGFLGASFAYAFNRGVNRGLFSNEAGQGSAPIAHASARAKDPVSEGL
ncbi:MAG: alanine glycine permease, partial [Bacteroidetes bacterium]